MVTRRQIRDYARKVVRELRPERVILFGSYAGGTPPEDSDVDSLVIMRHWGRAAEQATRIRLALQAPFPMDSLVRLPAKIRERLALGDWFIEDILNHGEVLYENVHS
jgi:predicted nucleotidyltransferase